MRCDTSMGRAFRVAGCFFANAAEKKPISAKPRIYQQFLPDPSRCGAILVVGPVVGEPPGEVVTRPAAWRPTCLIVAATPLHRALRSPFAAERTLLTEVQPKAIAKALGFRRIRAG